MLCLVELDVDAAVEGLEAELGMLQWVVYLLSSVNFLLHKRLAISYT